MAIWPAMRRQACRLSPGDWLKMGLGEHSTLPPTFAS